MVAQHTTSTGQFVAPSNWRAAPEEAPGGRVTAVGVHALDHMIEFGGRVSDVHCVTARYLPTRPPMTRPQACCGLRAERPGSIFCSVATATNYSFVLYGSRGLAEISKPDLRSFRFVPGSTEPPSGPVIAPPDEISEYPDFNMLNAELTEFARRIRDRRRPYAVPIADVLHGMSVLDAIVRSARRNSIEKVE